MSNKKTFINYKKGTAWGWGIFLLLIAALLLTNQFGGFIELGIWSILVSALAVAFMVQCVIDLSFASLPIPIAALYYIFRAPLNELLSFELPEIKFWPLALVTLLVTAGLHVLIPNSLGRKRKKIGVIHFGGDSRRKKSDDSIEEGQVEEGGDMNNPSISVHFGGTSKYLHSDCLETVELDCSFGGLEVYFDHVELSPNGADVYLNCKFGAIELYVPRHWRVVDNVNASLGGVDVKGSHDLPDDAPELRVTGNVSLGGVEVNRIK